MFVGQVFVSASPEHWCRIPELENASYLSLEERKALSLPYTVKSDGRRQYSKCFMYDVNYTAILDSWLQTAPSNESTSLGVEIDDTGGFVEDRDHDEDFAATSVDPTTILRFPRRRPPVPVSDPTWPTSKCRHGWNYDTRDYDSTLVTEVNSTKAAFLHLFFLRFSWLRSSFSHIRTRKLYSNEKAA